MLKITQTDLLSFQEKIRNDPVFFAETILKVPLWEKEREIMLAVRDNQEVAIRSCHASGKTFTAACIVHWWLLSWENSIVITTAPTFRQVKEILWREVRNAAMGKSIYQKDTILDTAINIGERWFALGLSTDRPDQFQGFHSPHLMVVVDEASGIEPIIEESIDGLTPEKIVRIGNPLKNTGRFAESFKNQNTAKMHISAFDTPNVRAGKIIIPGLITKEDVERIRQHYGEDSDVYRVKVLGDFPLADVSSFISINEVAKAMEREVEVNEHWEKKLGVDPARFGDDRTGIIIRQMEKILKKIAFSNMDTMQIAGQILNIAKEAKILPQNINIDIIGIGAGIVDRLREQGWNVNGVNVAEKADDSERYINKRAELYVLLKEWLSTGQLLKDDDFYELANMKYKFNSKGQMQMESKEDMKKRGLSSPDIADALMLTFAGRGIVTMASASSPISPYYGDSDIR